MEPEPREIKLPRFRVIAEGNDAVGDGLTLIEALAVLEFAREHGDRHVAIVDESTGVIVHEEMARKYMDVREVPRVLKEGLRTKKLKAKGRKRATTYLRGVRRAYSSG